MMYVRLIGTGEKVTTEITLHPYWLAKLCSFIPLLP